MKAQEIRERYLNFFKQKGHTAVKSDSLVPANDPTLLFTGAGMNQFKEYFMGIKRDIRRATSSQKCLRTGDLDNVGVTNYHHSFFEMLGNFSFADYFKREAITWAWEFLTTEMRIPKERLRVSVHTTDEEAYQIWHKEIGLDAKMIACLGDKSNFWPSNAPTDGPNGPCGPCSEIFFDQGEHVGCKTAACSVDCDCGRFAEIWNLVFTQFDRVGVNQLKPLGGKNIDTGMGLERLVCVMQGKRSNFETDLFEELIAYVTGLTSPALLSNDMQRRSIYAITDHLRAASFSIADGAYPSNEGRGYVIRKLIRRAVWHGRTIGLNQSFLAPMVRILEAKMSAQYPELKDRRSEVEQIITAEETRFRDRLDDGIVRLEQMIDETTRAGRKILSGEHVFRLYDTFGFPDELTSSFAEKKGLTIDTVEFNRLMEEQREKARGSSKISDSIFGVSESDKFVASCPATAFLGYEKLQENGCQVLAVIADGRPQQSVSAASQTIAVVLDRTPFYAESGGQAGDTGSLSNATASLDVTATAKVGGVFVHTATLRKGTLSKGDRLDARVGDKRAATMRNHTATHLLHAALRQVLGSHVRQFGSDVRDDKFRFDFSFQRALTAEELAKVEALVNEKISAAIPVVKEVKSLADAQKDGATALFGEKYGDTVRVITIGSFSKELCGGTHIDNTRNIERFIIVKESSISSGTRRIEAMTGDAARRFVESQKMKAREAEDKKVEKERLEKDKQGKVQALIAGGAIEAMLAQPVAVGVLKAYVLVADGLDRDGITRITDAVKQKVKQSDDAAIIVCANDTAGGKCSGMITIMQAALAQGFDAGMCAKALSDALGGRGGGKANTAFFAGTRVVSCDALKALVKSLKQ